MYHHIPSSWCLFRNVCAHKIGQIMIRPLHTWQGCAAAKSLAVLAGKLRLAVAGKFPIIP